VTKLQIGEKELEHEWPFPDLRAADEDEKEEEDTDELQQRED